MKILLIGEYSLVHDSLRKGLVELGHDVTIIGISNGFKCYPVDYDFDAKLLKNSFFTIPRKISYRLFKYDLVDIEYGIRFYFLLSKLKGEYDVVQFINEASIKTIKSFELYLIKKILYRAKKSFVLANGIDYLILKHNLENKSYKSIMQPYIQNPKKYKEFNLFFAYFKKSHLKIHHFIQNNFNGYIAGDFDYTEGAKASPIYKGLIPYPIVISKLKFEELKIQDKIVIFLGINKWSYVNKGICYFEEALEIIQKRYPEKVEIIVTNTVPYPIYIDLYNKSHILLDQAYAQDQGYNALEAMAKGKVVFTGAEEDFCNHYKINQDNRVCVNAKPDVAYLVGELSHLIENPQEIIDMGKRARKFVEKEHNCMEIAKKYVAVWNGN